MSQEGQSDAPISVGDDGTPTVFLNPDHPGSSDRDYRRRRNAILAAAQGYTPGDPAPEVEYSLDDHECWRFIRKELDARHHTYACTAINEASEALGLPYDHAPQLRTVSQKIGKLTGFGFVPAAGIVPVEEFYGTLADGIFQATQFIRHSSIPLFSPEPDMVHEIIGHGTALADKKFADLYRLVGRTVRRLETKEAVNAVSRFFWFTMEYGVIKERGEMMAFGASLLSSYGELAEFRSVEIRPIDVREMITVDYNYEQYQPILFHAESISHFEDAISEFCQSISDDSIGRLMESKVWV
ncbi:phenylalanine 4-monooxygenase [Streptomyces sp. NBC_00151]|uniref:phenylalanine 4-monooxygenase n=1 Tax=Streptomyces sp. NBC_00151 TaxID=2975669 RepID=UPI002DD81143|nr:phenylalanine 4-monooxygenase [Streptomyces sp. NBC_00151]WRZ40369.1 phenylalanine 4-monooxygenase [Streptomyces sp. NBC_00151]